MFQIAISAIRGDGYQGDIAIDNIKVLPNQCGKFSYQTPFISLHLIFILTRHPWQSTQFLYSGTSITDTTIQRTPPNNGQIFSSQNTLWQKVIPPYSGHLSTTDEKIGPIGVRYMEVPLYTFLQGAMLR